MTQDMESLVMELSTGPHNAPGPRDAPPGLGDAPGSCDAPPGLGDDPGPCDTPP